MAHNSMRYSDIGVSCFLFVALSFILSAFTWMLYNGDRNRSKSFQASFTVVHIRTIVCTDDGIVDLIYVSTTIDHFGKSGLASLEVNVVGTSGSSSTWLRPWDTLEV